MLACAQKAILQPQLPVEVHECSPLVTRSHKNTQTIKLVDVVFRKVTNVTDKQSLQVDLDKLVKWSEKLQMLFNFGKCKCIHIGHGNMDEECKMGDAVLGRTTQQKDLGVIFSADMKVSEQCRIAASKGNQILVRIREL